MSDTKLITPDRRVVSIDEARSEKKRPPGSKMKDLVSREEMMMAVGKASLALGQKMYDQVSGELSEWLEDQESRVQQGLRNEIAALRRELEGRTLVGRLRRFIGWLRGERPLTGLAQLRLEEQSVTEMPPMPGQIDDPKAKAKAELRRRISEAPDGADIQVPEGLTEPEAIAVAEEFEAELKRIAGLGDDLKVLETPTRKS